MYRTSVIQSLRYFSRKQEYEGEGGQAGGVGTWRSVDLIRVVLQQFHTLLLR